MGFPVCPKCRSRADTQPADACQGALDIDLGADRIDDKRVTVRIDALAADRRFAASPMLHRDPSFDDVRLFVEANGISSVCEHSTIGLEFPVVAG